MGVFCTKASGGGVLSPNLAMKKIFLSLSLIAAFFIYLLVKRANLGTALATAPGPGTTGSTGNGNSQPAAPAASSASNPPASQPQNQTPNNPPATPAQPAQTAASSRYRDGSYVGSVADAYYGYVQVKAVIRNGAIADVQFLQYPNTHSYSVYVNSQAMPYLTQEAVQAQNANVDIVSGATQTSLAFIQSLGSALTQAKA